MTTTLLQVCQELAKAADKGIEKKLHTYDYIKDFSHFPGVVIIPKQADFGSAFEQANDVWLFDLYLLVSTKQGDQLAQNELRELCDGHGPNSIRRAIQDNAQLTPDTVAWVFGLKNYSSKFQFNETPHVGALLQVKVQFI